MLLNWPFKLCNAYATKGHMKGTIAHSLSVSASAISSAEETHGKRHQASELGSCSWWMASGWKSHDQEEAPLYPCSGNIIHTLSSGLVASWPCACPCRFALGSRRGHLGGLDFVSRSTGSHGGFWAGEGAIKWKKEQNRAFGASSLGLSPAGSGTSKVCDLWLSPSFCEGHSRNLHLFTEHWLGAGHAGCRGRENPTVPRSCLVVSLTCVN